MELFYIYLPEYAIFQYLFSIASLIEQVNAEKQNREEFIKKVHCTLFFKEYRKWLLTLAPLAMTPFMQ